MRIVSRKNLLAEISVTENGSLLINRTESFKITVWSETRLEHVFLLYRWRWFRLSLREYQKKCLLKFGFFHGLITYQPNVVDQSKTAQNIRHHLFNDSGKFLSFTWTTAPTRSHRNAHNTHKHVRLSFRAMALFVPCDRVRAVVYVIWRNFPELINGWWRIFWDIFDWSTTFGW